MGIRLFTFPYCTVTLFLIYVKEVIAVTCQYINVDNFIDLINGLLNTILNTVALKIRCKTFQNCGPILMKVTL